MIGVDIIDLSCSFNQAKYSLEDYKNKILNKAEFAFCKTYIDLEYLWAIKESAYKCFYKKTSKSSLNPKKILVTYLDLELSTFHARIEDEFYLGSFRKTDQYIYAICFDKENYSGKLKVFISPQRDHISTKDELDFYSEDAGIKTSFLQHSMGFPYGLILGNNQYAYSRSHHGSYYISAITSDKHN